MTGSTRVQQLLGNFLVGSFRGFVWGWFQVPDYPPRQVGAHEIMTAYVWPLSACIVSYAVFRIAEHILRHKDRARAILHRTFAAAAVSTYSWYRLPGPASLLPDWFPLLSPIVTTPLFFWLLVVRSPKMSWAETAGHGIGLLVHPVRNHGEQESHSCCIRRSVTLVVNHARHRFGGSVLDRGVNNEQVQERLGQGPQLSSSRR
jgi:hypothetical protein